MRKMPSTPFSTRLSGSSKELELRLRSIFQWKKKRPPVVLLALAAAVALLCGSLVGFRAADRAETPDDDAPASEKEQTLPYDAVIQADFLAEIGKSFERLQVEKPGIGYQDVFIPDASGQCLGQEGDQFYYYFFGTQSAPGLSDLVEEYEYGARLKCAGIFTTVGELYPDMAEDVPLEQFFAQYGITEYTCTQEAQPDQGWIRFYDGKLQIWIDTNEDNGGSEDHVPTTVMRCDYPVLVTDKTIEAENYAIWEAVQPSWSRYTMTTSLGLTTIILEETPVPGYQACAVERIEVCVGDKVIQTIETADLTYDGDRLYEGLFVAHGYEIGEPDIRDFNFDGSQDLGLMTTATYPKNVPYAYFVWNDETEQFDFSFVLCSYLTVDTEQRQLYERVVSSDGWDEYNTYQFDSAGQLTRVNSRLVRPVDENFNAMESYYDILNGKNFLDADTGEILTLAQVSFAEEYPSVIQKFTVLDLDGDGVEEAVFEVQVGATYLYLILHTKGETTCGYCEWARGFSELKADGTYRFSAGAFDYGIGRYSFEEISFVHLESTYFQPYGTVKLTYAATVVKRDGTRTEQFVVDGELSTADEVAAAFAAQEEKPDAVWYEFTEENIEAVFSA